MELFTLEKKATESTKNNTKRAQTPSKNAQKL